MPNLERLLKKKYNSAVHCNDSIKKKANSQGVGLSFYLIEVE